MSMIEARDLTKRYESTLAVDRLSFTVRPGTVTGFLGPNGSGKSTTMRLIMGLDAPDGGRSPAEAGYGQRAAWRGNATARKYYGREPVHPSWREGFRTALG